MGTERLLVPLSESPTVRQTVAYAVQSGLEGDPETLACHLVVAVPYEADVPEEREALEAANRLLDRAKTWVQEDATDVDAEVSCETAVLGTDEYLFGPKDYADTFAAYVEEHDLDRLVLDPEYHPGASAPLLQPLERELERVDLPYVEAPVERPAQHERLTGTASWSRFLSLFGISFAFYLVLGDPTYWFDLVTGTAVGLIVALTLSHVTFTTAPTFPTSPLRVLRFSIYIPYLIFEIIKANLLISLVILRPSMPINPKMTRVKTRVRSGLPLLALANSITLTPGTLTVRANDQRLLVHTLIDDAREDLFDGSLERAIRFVFHGRGSAAIASPRERGDTEILESGGEKS
ncbi:monovalent cation/H+ antiporter subunit E [Natrialbaceae archaeon A-CW3]